MSSTAIVLAAGQGERFHPESRKQFTELLSKPVLQYSLELFDTLDSTARLIVVGPEQNTQATQALLDDVSPCIPTAVIPGGETRFESLQKGLDNVEEPHPDTVLIHDAARPGATVSLCEHLLNHLFSEESLSGVIPVIKIPDTVKRVEGGTVGETLDRRRLRRAQTPQVYRFDALRESVECWSQPQPPTDDAQLLERAGYTVGTIEGELRCRKLTYPEDLRILECLLGDDRS